MQRVRERDVRWQHDGHNDHLHPPGLKKDLLISGDMYLKLAMFHPGTVVGPHSHPGDILYLVVDGEMGFPGEGTPGVGDARWAPRDFVYPGEVVGAQGATMILVQSGSNGHASW